MRNHIPSNPLTGPAAVARCNAAVSPNFDHSSSDAFVIEALTRRSSMPLARPIPFRIIEDFYRVAAEMNCGRFGQDESEAEHARRVLDWVDFAIADHKQKRTHVVTALHAFAGRKPS